MRSCFCRFDEAETAGMTALRIRESVCALDDLRITDSLCILSSVALAKGQHEQAEATVARCLRMKCAALLTTSNKSKRFQSVYISSEDAWSVKK